AERPHPLAALLQFLLRVGAHREVEAAAKEAALAAGQPCGELVGVLGCRGDGRIRELAAVALEPPRRFEPGALAAQAVGRERRRQRLDVQRQVELTRRAQERLQPPARDLTRIADNRERARPPRTDAGRAAPEPERPWTER